MTTPKDVNLLPFDQAIGLYNDMKQAYMNDDEKKLEELKQAYPSLFEEETATLLRTTVEALDKMQHLNNKYKCH